MNESAVDKRNYDIASISRKGREKRQNYVQDALSIDPARVKIAGKFIRIFSDIFLKKELSPNAKAYF